MAENEVVQQEQTPDLPTQDAYVYEYQPKDDEGRALGGKQVIKAKDMQEALDKMAQQNSELLKMARKLKRDAALGTLQQEEEIPDTVERVPHGAYEFRPRQLSADEKWRITRDLDDPEKADQAFDMLLEARLGAKPEAIRNTLSQAQQDIAALRTQQEAKAFIDANSDYYVCDGNAQTLMGWMVKNNLSPNKSNFEYAYRRLKGAGLLLEAPIAAEEEEQGNTHPEPEPTGRITSEEPTPIKRPTTTTSGLTRSNSSTAGVSARKSGYSEAEINKMSAEEYRTKVLEPQLRRSRQQR